MGRYLSEMTEADVVWQYAYPVEHIPDGGRHFPLNPTTDDPSEFGRVEDANGHVIVTAQNGTCRLISVALNAYAKPFVAEMQAEFEAQRTKKKNRKVKKHEPAN